MSCVKVSGFVFLDGIALGSVIFNVSYNYSPTPKTKGFLSQQNGKEVKIRISVLALLSTMVLSTQEDSFCSQKVPISDITCAGLKNRIFDTSRY